KPDARPVGCASRVARSRFERSDLNGLSPQAGQHENLRPILNVAHECDTLATGVPGGLGCAGAARELSRRRLTSCIRQKKVGFVCERVVVFIGLDDRGDRVEHLAAVRRYDYVAQASDIEKIRAENGLRSGKLFRAFLRRSRGTTKDACG